MVNNQFGYDLFAGRAGGTRDEFIDGLRNMNVLPVAMIENEDTANAVVWLTSDEARYVTGLELRVDLGIGVKV
jgi:NAD(P)-dependent dehydrogenase (short-subunit alcohol dehydrogenase family)